VPRRNRKVGKLDERQERFCQEYLKDLNGTRAATRAGYSAKTARSKAAQLLTTVNVKARVDELQARREQRTEITQDSVLRELARIGFSDARKLFDENGKLKPVGEWDDQAAAAVSSVEVTEEFAGRGADREQVGFTKKVRLWDKVNALVNMGKHLGMFDDKVQHVGAGGGPIRIEVVYVSKTNGHG
jgi:phage terminase small subunit